MIKTAMLMAAMTALFGFAGASLLSRLKASLLKFRAMGV